MKHLALLCLVAAAALPAAAQPTPASYAAQLAAQALVRHPELSAVTIHAGPAAAQPVQQISTDGAQLVTTLPLQDVSGDPVGSVDVAFPITAGNDRQALLKRAEAVRNELRRHVINAANLADPVPYVAGFPSAPYAQQLVDHAMAAHPELLVVALHVATLASDGYPIIASSIGRIGKKADEDDMRVITSGKPAAGAYGANKTRYGIELPMYDTVGKLLGALSVGYAFKAGDDEPALLRQAQQVEAELRARIPSLARLYGPAL